MKKLLFLVLIVAGCVSNKESARETLSLAGEWNFGIDSLDQGIDQQWYSKILVEKVILPGSMAENGKGYEVTLKTDWTGDIFDRSYFTEKKYEKYRQPGNIKIPFWLKPVKYYKGPAWYQKEVELPDRWTDKRVVLFLERCHWESTVYVNGHKAGTMNGLATPHEYDITDLLVKGKNLISIRIDNRVIIPIGVNSHSISDQTQSNWNGIAGNISLLATSRVFINNIRVFPDIQNKSAKVIVSVKNPENMDFKGKLKIRAQSFNTKHVQKLSAKNVTIVTNSDEHQVVLEYKIRNPQLWSEFTPSLYKLSVTLLSSDKNASDHKSVNFGMREFKPNGTRFAINGQAVFLRGTTECCIFPLTGYPPADAESWEKVLQTCKDYGLNHVRFHSYCPPEAAFIAADKLGIYFHVECSSWPNQASSIGDGGPADKFIYDEGDRIIKEYGNHPSFCMLASSNEPGGRNRDEYLEKLVTYWRSIDNRRVYTSGGGWPIIPENEYNITAEPRIQHWGEGLKSIINAHPPQTMFDYHDFTGRYNVPTVGHEIGQWCVYPDFKEIAKYTGVLRATNFEIFRETLADNHMGDQAEAFLMASGKLQVLCYKADIEAALRTKDFGGFELLQLHDFPGQGTALVGILNPFFESKGYVTPDEFKMFCNQTVPLARMKKLIYKNGETFEARVEIAHFGAEPIRNAEIECQVRDSDGQILRKETMTMDEIAIGNGIIPGLFTMDITGISTARKLTFGISLAGTPFTNSWDFWVYPQTGMVDPGKVLITNKLDKKGEETLKDGGSVLLLTYGNVGKDKGAQIAIGFSSIFWNTSWTNNQAPHTLGILCDPEHPLFDNFPTEYYSNWQWWDPVSHSQAMILDGFPADLKPLVQPIDTWFENRRLALAFETKIYNGKLMVCSIDLNSDLEERPVSQQFMNSLLGYMNSKAFNPDVEVDIIKIKELTKN